MAAFNVVRYRVKPGNEQRFIEVHRKLLPKPKGFVRGGLIQTGDNTFCTVGERRNFQSIAAARPEMIAVLDQLRDNRIPFLLDACVALPPIRRYAVMRRPGSWQ